MHMHIASYVALGAVIAFFITLAWPKRESASGAAQNPPSPSRIRSTIYTFFAGALFANSIPHFIHGISGEYFPGPLSYALGRGTTTNIVNVLWGLFCFGAGCQLVRRYRNANSSLLFSVLVSSGFTAMSIFLAVVFTRVR